MYVNRELVDSEFALILSSWATYHRDPSLRKSYSKHSVI